MNAPNIILICWLIFLAYWAINWKVAKPAEETVWKIPGFRWVIVWGVVLIIIISHILFPSFHLHVFSDASGPFSTLQLGGVILAIIGLIVAIVARKTLADNWSSNVDIKKNHKLITKGVYSVVRHPIYTGIIAMGIGSVMVDPTIPDILFFLIMIGYLNFKKNTEEKLLSKHFSKDYASYKKKTKALIPFIY